MINQVQRRRSHRTQPALHSRICLARVRRVVGVAAAVALVGFSLALSACGQTTLGVGAAPATDTPAPPSSATLMVSAPGMAPTTQSPITIPSGTAVTLTVVPNHSLVPFQTDTMGIYAHDPYPFSELQYCTYPNTDTCTYTVAFSSAEHTDYTRGTHTFTAFLGDIGGRIVSNSNNITITWSS